MKAIEILYEDQHLAVINKPAGLLSQSDHSGDVSLVDELRKYFGRHYVGLIHRLDRNTSGVLLVGKRSKTSERLTKALQEDEIHRTYLALVEGTLTEAQHFEHFLIKNPTENKTQVLLNSSGKKAILDLIPLQSGKTLNSRSTTWIQIQLETGRSHQIRAQLSHEQHPIVGDRKYQSHIPFDRPVLHSWKISFPHPMTKEILKITAPIPEEFLKLGLNLDSLK